MQMHIRADDSVRILLCKLKEECEKGEFLTMDMARKQYGQSLQFPASP